MADHTGPHKALINISFTVYPVDPVGELSGRVVHRSKIREAEIAHKILEVKGATLQECLENLKEKMESIK